MSGILKKILLLLPMVVILFFLQREVDIRQAEFADLGVTRELPDPNMIKVISLGHEEVIADYYWVKAVLFEGGELMERDYHHFSDLIDMVTTLDPHFQYPYLFGSIILSVIADDPEGSDRLLMKGYALHSDCWRFPFGLGYNAYFYHGDARRAARYIGIASRLEDHPPYLPRLATRLYYESRDLDVAIRFLSTILRDTENEEQRKVLQKRLDALGMIQQLEKLVAKYRREMREEPGELDQLVRTGYLVSIPHDPYGGEFFLDENGTVLSTSKLRPVHRTMKEGEHNDKEERSRS